MLGAPFWHIDRCTSRRYDGTLTSMARDDMTSNPTARPLHILLTGAGSGLGRGLAIALAAEGHRLHLADVQADGVAETIKQMGDAGAHATAHQLDVTSSNAIET